MDKRNVVVIQCQDGKLTSGLLVTSLFIYCHLFMSPECAFEMFNIRRQNMSTRIVPSPSQKHYFNYITQLINDTAVKPHKYFLTINAFTMEPVPLFNRARKGCRPFIEVYNGDKRVLTTAREIEQMREYTVSDQQIDCKLRLEIQGDVTICVYHGRSTLGGKVQGKLTSIPMFQIQFHTGFIGVKAKKMVFIKEDIDVPDANNMNKFAENFNLTLDVTVDENHCNDMTYVWDSGPNEKATRQLLFTTSEEYLQCQEDFVLGDDREMSYREQFEMDKKSRHENTANQGSADVKADSSLINNKTKPGSGNAKTERKPGSFFENLEWEADEEPLKESSESDEEWDALRSGNTQNESNNTARTTFDFFGETEPQRSNNEANFDLFNLRQGEEQPDHTTNDTNEDLLGLAQDSKGQSGETRDPSVPSPRPRKGTRHSSLGEDQLQSDFDLLNLSNHSKEDSEVDLLGLNSSGGAMKRNKSADDIFNTSPTENKVSDDIFADLRSPSNNSNTPPQSNSTQSFDPFAGGKAKNVDLFYDFSTNTSGSSGPILTPQVNTSWKQNTSASEKTTSSDPFADLGGLGSSNGFGKLNGNTAPEAFPSFQKKSPSPTPKPATPAQQKYGFQNSGKASPKVQKPNYAPSFSTAAGSVFGSYGLRDGYVNKPVKKDEFSDILNSHGFKATPESGPSTMNSLRQQTEEEDDPVKAKIRGWSDGKRKNIRALLCSLDTVLWEEEKRWKKVGMHELVTADQVKKYYKRAVLSVHPDKLIGTPQEHLARAIFIELNESWTAFEESGSKSLY